jgi:hypothetical protein
MCHIGMGFRTAHQVHLLAVLSEDVAVLAGRGALRDEAHPAAIHALLQLPLDDLQVDAPKSAAVLMHTPVYAAEDRPRHLQLLTMCVCMTALLVCRGDL